MIRSTRQYLLAVILFVFAAVPCIAGGLTISGSNPASSITGQVAIANGGTGAASATAGFDALAPTTTRGDLIYRGVTNNVRLAKGTSGHFLKQGTDDPAWAQPAFSDLSGTATVPMGGTGVTSTTAYAVLCGGTTSTGALQSIASVGTSGQVLTSNGAGALPTFQTASTGKIAQVVDLQFTTQTSTTSTTIPFDNTKPQSTEGAELFTGAFTPTNASSTLYLWLSSTVATTGGPHLAMVVFRDSETNPLMATWVSHNTDGDAIVISAQNKASALNTSAQTFKIRWGVDSGTGYVNGNSSGNIFGGAMITTLRITEVLP